MHSYAVDNNTCDTFTSLHWVTNIDWIFLVLLDDVDSALIRHHLISFHQFDNAAKYCHVADEFRIVIFISIEELNVLSWDHCRAHSFFTNEDWTFVYIPRCKNIGWWSEQIMHATDNVWIWFSGITFTNEVFAGLKTGTLIFRFFE